MMLRSFTGFVFLLSTALQSSSAQSASFDVLRDSLNRLSDAAVLRRMESQHRPARNATPEQRIAHGLIALRLYTITDDPSASKLATSSFESAVDHAPQSGWAQFGLGLSLAASPQAKPLNEGGSAGRFVLDDVAKRLTGHDARSRARRAFSAALHTRPPVNSAARELATLALKAQNTDWLKEARSELQTVSATPAVVPEDRVALSEVQAALGELQAAIVESDRAISASGRTGTSLFAAAVARLRVNGREEEGATLYYEGVRAATSEELERYYDDVLPIARPAEKSKWNSGNLEARRELLLKFWDVRAALGGFKSYQRLAEHYRRLPYVEQNYRRQALYGAPERNELRWQPNEKRSRFDDRGEIYLRHGKPDQELRTLEHDFDSDNESWVYHWPDGTSRMFHFFRARGGFSLPYIVPCNTDFLRDRAGQDPNLGRFYVRCDQASAALYSASMREVYYEALETDTHYPRVARELPFYYDLYTFRGQPGRTAVVAAFAVPATKLEKNVDDQGVHYRFDVSLILADTALGTVSRTDDSASIRMARGPDNDDLLRTHLEVQVPPSGSTLQRVIMTDPTAPGIGQYYGGPFPIPDYSGKDLMLSDIALGQVSRSSGWKRGDVTLTLVPTSQFPTGSFHLFYEIYNLPAGRTYTTDVLIERTDKSAGGRLRDLFGAGDDVRTTFSGESTARPDGTLAEIRRIEAPLRKGRYRLTVTVKDNETGQSAKRSRAFRIP